MEGYFQKLASQAKKKFEESKPEMERMLESVKHAAEDLQQKARGNRDPRTRGPPTPHELASQDLCYVTDRLISSTFPVDRTKPGAAGKRGNDLDIVAALLRHRHPGHYMVWNISEEGYDYGAFEDQVLEYRFPGHPAPPLGMLFKMCTAIESWLVADPLNVALVHCQTGKGRTATVLACFLAWVGDCGSPQVGLQWVAQRKSVNQDRLTVPSQRRYIEYFSNMLDGARPRGEPLILHRVIMNRIPAFGSLSGAGEDREGAEGCCPYIQLFKNGHLIFTTAAQSSTPRHHNTLATDAAAVTNGNAAESLTWVYPSDESVSFVVDCPIQGDILLRCRHLGAEGERVSMYRAAFHTGYVPCGVMRLGKQDLDGAADDDRFREDFFLDLIFAAVESPSSSSESGTEGKKGGAPGGTTDGDAVEAYEAMLLRDSRFWDDLAERKARRMASSPRSTGHLAGETSPYQGDESHQFPLVNTGNAFSISAEADEDNEGDILGLKKSSKVSLHVREGTGESGLAGAKVKDSEDGDSDDLLRELAALEASPASEEEDIGAENSAGVTAAVVSSRGDSIPPIELELSAEMQALEDLEKELGIGGLSRQSEGTGGRVDGDALDADLDELEGFLESLQG